MPRRLLVLLAFLGCLALCPLRAGETAAAEERLLQEAGVATDGPGLLEFFRRRTPDPTDRARLEALVRRLGSGKFADRARASRELIAAGPQALLPLRLALKGSELELSRRAELCIRAIEEANRSSVTAAAVRQLARRAPPAAVKALLDYVPHADDGAVEEEVFTALLALGGRPGKADAALTAALRDTLPARRGAAAHVLGRRGDKDVQAAVRPLLADADSLVRLRAARSLTIGKDRTAVAVLVELLTDDRDEVASQAEELLLLLAGEKAPDSTGNAADTAARRKQVRTAWAGWWKANALTADLGRLSQEQPLLGLTVVVEADTGRVAEYGRDGKLRWQLSIPSPMDAQALPGNRVLVAESAGRLTERDPITGKVLWEQRVEGEPINCRRLPGGSTFVGTRNAAFEIARDGKLLRTVRLAGAGYCHAVHRTRVGHFLFLSNTGVITEMDPAGKVVRTVTIPHEGSWGQVIDIPGGKYLVCNYGTGKVFEIDFAGKKVWEHLIPSAASVERLPGGLTLVGCFNRAAVLERGGRVAWETPLPGSARRIHRR